MEWINTYRPKDGREEEDKSHLLHLPQNFIGLNRACPYHYTTSAMVLDSEDNSLLMIYHPIYQSWSWPGGHVEEGEDLFASVLREIYEETGLEYIQPLDKEPLGFELLPVKAHTRKGQRVEAHFHINFSFGFYGKKRDLLLHQMERQTMWVPLDKLEVFVGEAHMLPLYHKYLQRIEEKSGKKSLG